MSSGSEELILVDEDDNEIGHLSKADCHDGGGVLHRAFSVFLFAVDGRLLLQQRASTKRLWPGFWSNSCCSHPRRGETMQIATRRRLRDELNVDADLEYVYRFQYQAQYDEHGAERELCHVYVGGINAEVRPNQHEIEAVRLLSATELTADLKRNPEKYTPWFRMEWCTLNVEHAELMARYAI